MRVKDPRLGFVTITDARVTGDLQRGDGLLHRARRRRGAGGHRRGAGERQGRAALRGRPADRRPAHADAGVRRRRRARERRRTSTTCSPRPPPPTPRCAALAATARRTPASADPYRHPATRTRPTSRRRGRPRPQDGAHAADDAAERPGRRRQARRARPRTTSSPGCAGWPAPAASATPARSTRWPPACSSLGVERATRLLGHLARRRQGRTSPPSGSASTHRHRRRRGRGRCDARTPRGVADDAPSTPAVAALTGDDPAGARRRSARSRSTAGAPTRGCAPARRSSWPPRPVTVRRVRRARATRRATTASRSSTSTSRVDVLHPARTSARWPATSAPRSASAGHLTALRRTRVGPYGLERRAHARAARRGLRVLPLARRRAARLPGPRAHGRRGAPARPRRPAARRSGWARRPAAAFAPDGALVAVVSEEGRAGPPAGRPRRPPDRRPTARGAAVGAASAEEARSAARSAATGRPGPVAEADRRSLLVVVDAVRRCRPARAAGSRRRAGRRRRRQPTSSTGLVVPGGGPQRPYALCPEYTGGRAAPRRRARSSAPASP